MKIFEENRHGTRLALVFMITLILLTLFSQVIPGFLQPLLKLIVFCGWSLLILILLVFLFLQIILNFRYERSYLPNKFKVKPFRKIEQYAIINPLNAPGTFRKAQLHAHTNRSYDSDTSPEEVVASYQKDGYNFLVITDHDRYSDFSGLSTENCLVIPGIEKTVPVLSWPLLLGRHLVIINPKKRLFYPDRVERELEQASAGQSLAIPAHLGWRGGAGSGRWYPQDLLKLKNLKLIEIHSPHSRDPFDFIIWHKLNIQAGPSDPVWGVAVDDSHDGSNGKGWVMVKTNGLSVADLVSALKNGAFYATAGPTLDITVCGTDILVKSPEAKFIRFINAQNQVIFATRGTEAIYHSYGDEGFIRVEAANPRGRTAWSQPMWLVPVEDSQ